LSLFIGWNYGQYKAASLAAHFCKFARSKLPMLGGAATRHDAQSRAPYYRRAWRCRPSAAGP